MRRPPAPAASQVRLGVWGLAPAKPFSFSNLGQSQAKHRRAGRKPGQKQGEAPPGFGGSQAKARAKHRPGFGGSQAKARAKHRRAPAEARLKAGEAPPGFGGSQAKGRRSTAGLRRKPGKSQGEAPPSFSNLNQGRGRTSVKNRKGGFFRLYDSLWIPLAALPKKYTLPQGQVVRRALFAPSPCPRGVASETGGVGASPRKTFQLQ